MKVLRDLIHEVEVEMQSSPAVEAQETTGSRAYYEGRNDALDWIYEKLLAAARQVGALPPAPPSDGQARQRNTPLPGVSRLFLDESWRGDNER